MSEDLISKQTAYKVLSEYYHHKTEMQHKALRVALDMVPSAELQPTCNQLATDCISRQAAIDAIEEYADRLQMVDWKKNPGVPYKAYALNWCINTIRDLPPAQPDIIQCRNCKFASGDSRICMKFGHSPIGELDFCSWAERRTDE